MKHLQKKFIAIVLLFWLVPQSYAQYGTGLIKDTKATERIPLAAPLMRGEYSGLPPQYSLKKYAPTPQNQGDYGTCVGWAVAYASRTILYAKSKGIYNTEEITQLALSPYFLYERTKPSADLYCQDGTTLSRGLDELKKNGVIKFSDFKEICNQSITLQHLNTAKRFRINEYKRLFDSGASSERKIQVIKKSIAEGKPVVVGIECCNASFLGAKGQDYWYPDAEDEIPYGGHAVAVIAYDDSKYGGSVQIMNSWGTLWGNEGFIWIPYDDFAEYCFEAYEMDAITISNKETKAVKKNKSLSGSIRLELSAGKNMPVKYKSFGYYETTEGYFSGTSFRIYLSNQEPAYVYVIGSDLTHQVFTIFPFKNTTPYLNYKSNNIAIPDESHYITLDNKKGIDYLCVLYSVKPLDINAIAEEIQKAKGTFAERVRTALGTQLVGSSNVLYNQSGIMNFKGNGNEQTVVPIILGITHI